VYDHLRANFPQDQLRRAFAWIVLYPEDGEVLNNLPELGLRRHPPPVTVRSRSVLYARKFLGRLLNKITD
jgi:ABC-2 type transport system permease protein